MKKALPKNEGTISGQKLLSPPSQLHSMYVGIMVTAVGIMSVPMLRANRMLRPLNGIRARAKAMHTLEISVPMMFHTTRNTVLV